jgi:quinol monooxygenase YgiN
MILTIEIRAREEKFQEIYQMLLALVPAIRKEKGCIECRIYRDIEDGNVFFLSVRWRQRADLANYMGTNNGSALLGAIDLLGEAARVMLGENSPWESIDALKRLRSRERIIN